MILHHQATHCNHSSHPCLHCPLSLLSSGHLNPPSPSCQSGLSLVCQRDTKFLFFLCDALEPGFMLLSCSGACLLHPRCIQTQTTMSQLHETRVRTARWTWPPKSHMALVKALNLCEPQFPHYTRKQKLCSGNLGYGVCLAAG